MQKSKGKMQKEDKKEIGEMRKGLHHFLISPFDFCLYEQPMLLPQLWQR